MYFFLRSIFGGFRRALLLKEYLKIGGAINHAIIMFHQLRKNKTNCLTDTHLYAYQIGDGYQLKAIVIAKTILIYLMKMKNVDQTVG